MKVILDAKTLSVWPIKSLINFYFDFWIKLQFSTLVKNITTFMVGPLVSRNQHLMLNCGTNFVDNFLSTIFSWQLFVDIFFVDSFPVDIFFNDNFLDDIFFVDNFLVDIFLVDSFFIDCFCRQLISQHFIVILVVFLQFWT